MIRKFEDGACVISSRGTWLPGVYEDERTAKYAFRIKDTDKSILQNQAIERGDRILKYVDIKNHMAKS